MKKDSRRLVIVSSALRRDVILSGIIALVLGVFEFTGIAQVPRSYLERLFVPLQVSGVKIAQVVSLPLAMLDRSYNKTERIQELEASYSQAQAQLTELDSLREENEELRRILGQVGESGLDGQLVEPILSLSKPTIAGGSEQGIREGSVVLIEQTFIGVVSEVTSRQAVVRLLSAQDSRSILVRTESGIEGVVQGDGKKIILTEIPRDEVLVEGERLVTLGQPGIERGLYVGEIGRIENEPQASVQTAAVRQSVDFYSASFVEVYR